MENFSTYFGTLKSEQVKNNTLEKRKKNGRIGMREIKLSLFIDEMIIYLKRKKP